MKRLAAGLMAFGLMTTGCETKEEEKLPQVLEAASTAQALTSDYRVLAGTVADALAFLNDSTTVSDATASPCPPAVPGMPPEPCVDSDAGIDFKSPATQSADWLATHLFNSEHLSAASTPTAPVFCLKADDACSSGADAGVDAQCVKTLTDVPVCVKVSSINQGQYDLQLLLGKTAEMNPVNGSLSPTRVTAEVRLADVKAAGDAIATSQGEPLGAQWPKRAVGTLGAELTRLAEKSFQAKLSVKEAVEVDLYDATDARRTELKIAVAPELAQATVDGVAKHIDASLKLQAVDLKLALETLFASTEQVCDPSPNPRMPPSCHTVEHHYTGHLLAQLAGLGGTMSYALGADKLESASLSDLSLGDETSRLLFQAVGGQPTQIGQLDLNAALGRRLNVALARQAEGVKVTVTPSLDLLVSHDLQALAGQFSDLKGWALKAVSQVKLSGTSPAMLQREAREDGTGGGMQVAAGSLELRASGMLSRPDVTVTASALQCLNDVEGPAAEGAHPFESLVAGVCQ